MERREVYPNPPIALVAVEVRFPPVDDRTVARAHDPIAALLGSDWILQNEPVDELRSQIGPDGAPSFVSSVQRKIVHRKLRRVVTVQSESLTLEVTDYVGFDDFRALLAQSARAIAPVLHPSGVTRAGLRYIDEITVTQADPDWSAWLDPSVLPPVVDGISPTNWSGAAQYRISPDQLLVLRYGPSPTPVVTPTHFPRRRGAPFGPVFVLDFDGSWQPDEVPVFDAEEVATRISDLRAPIRQLFDAVISDKLQKVFKEAPQ